MINRRDIFILVIFLLVLSVRILFTDEPPQGVAASTITGYVVREPERFTDRQRVIVKREQESALIRLTVPLQPRVQFGDVLAFRCERKQQTSTQTSFTDSSFFHVPLAASCMYPSWKIVGTRSSVTRSLFLLKNTVLHRLVQSMPAPEGFVVSAMLLGNGSMIPQNIWDDVRVTGTTHLLVISGMHIAVLAHVLLWCCTFLPIPRRVSLVLVAAFLLLYVLLAGLQSATVRALVFGLVMFCAEWFERRVSPARLFVYAAMLMILVQPRLLTHDIGFQLSFAAVAGIFVFTHFLTRFRETPHVVTQFVTATLGANLFTMPIIAWHFHTMSLIGFLVNLVAIPLITIVMAGGVITMIVTIISSSAAMIVGLPFFFLLRGVLIIIAWCARIPFASLSW